MISKTMEMIDRPYFDCPREVFVKSSTLLQILEQLIESTGSNTDHSWQDFLNKILCRGTTAWCSFNASSGQWSKSVNSYCLIIWNFCSCYCCSSSECDKRMNRHLQWTHKWNSWCLYGRNEKFSGTKQQSMWSNCSWKKKKKNRKLVELIKVTWKNTWKREELMQILGKERIKIPCKNTTILKQLGRKRNNLSQEGKWPTQNM